MNELNLILILLMLNVLK